LHGPTSAQDGHLLSADGQSLTAVLGGPVESEGAIVSVPNGQPQPAPSLSPLETGEGQNGPADTAITFVPSPVSPELIIELQELQVRRKHWIRQSTKTINGISALVRREMGWGQEGADAKEIKEKAAAFVKAFMSVSPPKPPKLDKSGNPIKPSKPRKSDKPLPYSPSEFLLYDLICAKEQMEISWRAERTIVLRMEKLAQKLPAYAFAKSVAGFGDLGFAVLVGEAGDLAKYQTSGNSRGYEKLWKRLGLAPYQGMAYSNWKKPKARPRALTENEWIEAGYAPRRRAEVFAVIEDSLFRHQSWRKGPYYAIYEKRRERTAETHPDWSKGHSHGDAKRIMVKCLMADLWKEWRTCVL
jgi:hypothetical protein